MNETDTHTVNSDSISNDSGQDIGQDSGNDTRKNNTDELVLIGLSNPKRPTNMGAILRAANCFIADAVYYSGQRIQHAMKFHTDTNQVRQKIPMHTTDNLTQPGPTNITRVAVELVEGAQPLTQFQHPPRAIYLFGPEDGSLSQSIVDQCEHVVYIPTEGCLNLAQTVTLVLYDRNAKSTTTVNDPNAQIRRSRDNNNRLKVRSG